VGEVGADAADPTPRFPLRYWPTPKPEKIRKARRAQPSPEGPRGPAPPRLSVVILPFLNIGGDAQDDHFGRRHHRDADHRPLALVPVSLRSRANTAFAYKGKLIDTRQIGRELGVRICFSKASVQDAGETDAVSMPSSSMPRSGGASVGRARFDKERGDLLDMQDEGSRPRLARTILIELIAAERADGAGARAS